jgi:hypothetical protein
MNIRWTLVGKRIADWLGGKNAWRLTLGLFLLEALWFACSAAYPMAFDENYHFGLIKLHAQQWLPFFTVQPHDAAVYGAVVRDPSYLYHWLMSYPYRLVNVFTHQQSAQIIFLRFINVGIFAAGLLMHRRLLRRIGVSEALSTSLLAVFVLVPVVPFLAAHVNYDNLFFLAIPLSVLYALRLLAGFEKGTVGFKALCALLATLFLSSLIKYPFLPVFVVIALFVVIRAWRLKLIGLRGWRALAADFRVTPALQRGLLIALVLVSFGLFAERYIANVITYHNPVPACDAVMSQDECVQYGPYGRDHLLKAEKPSTFRPNIFIYICEWFYGMWYRLFFAINSVYATSPPLFVVSRVAIGAAALMGVGIALRFRQLFAGKPARQLLLWLVVGYGLILFEDGFSSYAKTGQPVAINGRYWIPFLPFVFAFGGLAWSQLLRSRPLVKPAVAGLVIAVFLLQGGGTMTFIIRSGDDWMWNNNAVRTVNRTVRSMAWPVILGKGMS